MKLLLIVPSYPNISGVDYHRLVMPHSRLGLMFPDCDISQINEIDSMPDELLKDYDLIVANRFISKFDKTQELIWKLRRVNVPYILDLDDDYRIPQDHILHSVSKKSLHSENILMGISGAAAVTVTHELLAATIKAETGIKMIAVIPNGIEPEGQFSIVPCTFKDRVNFGWSGSITHFEDVMLMADALRALYLQPEYKDKFRVMYGGYAREDITSQAIAGVLCAKKQAPEGMFHLFPTSPVESYANFYDTINVKLIPLRNNRFNNLKSNLKLLESGFKKKAVICSDVYPYSPLLRHKVNSLVVKHKNDWYKNMKLLIDNPAMIEDLGEQLYQDVQPYHMERVAAMRMKVYQDLMQLKLQQ